MDRPQGQRQRAPGRIVDRYSESAWKSLAVKSLRLGWPEGLRQAETRLSGSTMQMLLLAGIFEDVLPPEGELSDVVAELERRFCEQGRVVFLTVSVLGLRRGEVRGLRWRHVSLADPEGARLRVEETWIAGHRDTPKSEASERTIALGSRLAEELFAHRARSHYAGDDEFVFCHPTRGTPLNPAAYGLLLRRALERAKITKPLRPFHDGRHTALTNAAAAGNAPAAIQARAGHASFATTQLYIDLAGVTFRDEAQAAEDRLLGNLPQLAGPDE